MSAVTQFHPGERVMHQLLKIPRLENPTSPGLPRNYAIRVISSPLMAMGTLDREGRPWTTVWGGETGFAQTLGPGVIGVQSLVNGKHDPVFRALWDEVGRGKKAMAALTIDLQTRDRVKLSGMMVGGAAEAMGAETEEEEGEGVMNVHIAMAVSESLGNCPKYLNKRAVVPSVPSGEMVAAGLPLGKEALTVLEKADMFFVSTDGSSSDGGPQGMDTNYRGGGKGFMRVLKNDEEGVELVYPEFSGNRLYQTLGNLKLNPLVGITVPDFDTGDVLHLTGSAEVLVGEAALAVMNRTNLAVKIKVTDAKFIKSGLPFRGKEVDYSPYNPPIRRLVTEAEAVGVLESEITATLTKKEEITPTINRFTFRLSSMHGKKIPTWYAGQHLTLNFEQEVGSGYAHMKDDDPQSLNDDYVRTFTISSPPPADGEPGWQEVDVQITARKKGPVTGFLWRYNVRAPLEIPVIGIAGEEGFRVRFEEGGQEQIFIAAGVGITPLLAQARDVLASPFKKLTLLWSLRGEDLPLAVDSFKNNPGLAAITKLYITGHNEPNVEPLQDIEGSGAAQIEMRRIMEGDVNKFKGVSARFYLCTGMGMRKALEGWLEGENVAFEDFGY